MSAEPLVLCLESQFPPKGIGKALFVCLDERGADVNGRLAFHPRKMPPKHRTGCIVGRDRQLALQYRPVTL
jgi:hypothetical protein